MPSPSPLTRAFEPHHLHAMLGAFDVVCAQLGLPTHEGGWARKRVASMIFDLAMSERSALAPVILRCPHGEVPG
jgi:hypothetical protein